MSIVICYVGNKNNACALPLCMMNNTEQNISVIIPVYNEEKSLPKVLKDLPGNLVREIIVVDNASSDKSAETAKALGARVIYEPQKGYGRACLTGMAALDPDCEIVVFLDGDHSDHPEQLALLVDPIVRGGFDFVIGSRVLGQREKGAMTPQALYGNKLACFLMKMFWGYRYFDLGPFRAIRHDALKELRMADEDFGWTIEMQIKALEHGLRVKEVAVDYRRRIGRSKISGTLQGTILAGGKILWTIFKYKFLPKPQSPRSQVKSAPLDV